MKGFMDFVREQGVVGLAVGFILGGAVSGFVQTIVDGLVNPLIAALFSTQNLEFNSTQIGDASLLWGAVVAAALNFAVIAAVVYFGVKGLGLDKLDKAKK